MCALVAPVTLRTDRASVLLGAPSVAMPWTSMLPRLRRLRPPTSDADTTGDDDVEVADAERLMPLKMVLTW